MPNPSLRAVSSANGSTVGSTTCVIPVGTQAGDLMLAFTSLDIFGGGVLPFVAPSGWTAFKAFSDTNLALTGWYKVAGASEPANYTWSDTSGLVDLLVCIVSVQNAGASPEVSSVNHGALAGGTTLTATGVTALGTNRFMVEMFADCQTHTNVGRVPGTFSGGVSLTPIQNGAQDVAQRGGTLAIAASGATGNFTALAGSAGDTGTWIAILALVGPVVGPTGLQLLPLTLAGG